MEAVTLQTRKCIECEKTLTVSHDAKKSNFYPIKAKNEEASRWENKCKSCKKTSRKNKSITTINEAPLLTPPPHHTPTEYPFPCGEKLALTKDELARISNVFRLLINFKRKKEGKQLLKK